MRETKNVKKNRKKNIGSITLGAHLVALDNITREPLVGKDDPQKNVTEKKVNTYGFSFNAMNKPWYVTGDKSCGQVSSKLCIMKMYVCGFRDESK